MASTRTVSVLQQEVGLTGSLRYWTGLRWKSAIIKLHSGVLYKADAPIAHLDICSIYPDPKDDRVFVVESGMQKYYFKGETDEICMDWLETLSIATQMKLVGAGGDRLTFAYQLVRLLVKDYSQVLESLQKVKGSCREAGSVMEMAERYGRICEEALADVGHVMTGAQKYETVDTSLGKPASEVVTTDDVFYDAQDEPTPYQSNPTYRTFLPIRRNPRPKLNLWNSLKDSIGKELSKVPFPVYFNEPLSTLQRFAEDLSCSDILQQANDAESSLLRLALVSCFAVTSYSQTYSRTLKPFNPLLGETFELETCGLRIIAEQVSHHPPISALHAEHEAFLYWGQAEIRSAFKGTHIVITPIGDLHVVLRKPGNEHYVWQKPQTSIHNLIVGRVKVEHHGVIEVLNLQTQEKSRIAMRKAGWFGSGSHQIEGIVLDSTGFTHYTIFGDWSETLLLHNEASKQTTVVWEMPPAPADAEYYYHLPEFAMQLNLPPTLYSPSLAPTDSRWRPDQRALENGDLMLAVAEKERLEEKQRKGKKDKDGRGEKHQPRWFTLREGVWSYAGGYWEAKEEGRWQRVMDIY
jgi:hypothetical protein